MSKDNEQRASEIKVSMKPLSTCAYDPTNPLPVKIQDAKNPERVIRFRASDDTCDRYDEVILPSGWVLNEFIQNPVIMRFHDYHSWPLGQGIACGVIGNALYIDCEFDPPEIDEEADMVFNKISHGSIRTGSVGFVPLEYALPGKGASVKSLFDQYPKAKRIFTKQSLIEFTICPIPANPNALAASMQKSYEKRFGDAATENGNEQETDPIGRSSTMGLALLKINEMKSKIGE